MRPEPHPFQHLRIVIFGATGGTGREVVRQALTSGHDVTAFVRQQPTNLAMDEPTVTLSNEGCKKDRTRHRHGVALIQKVTGALS
jgi:putative NADH-flavin reductase